MKKMSIISNTVKNKYNTIKNVLYIAIGLVALYYLILLITPKPDISPEFKAKLESLSKITDSLVKKQKEYDLAIQIQSKLVDRLNHEIDSVQGSKTIIKEFYHEQSKTR